MTSPIRRQYLDVKARHPDALVLFRMGDFYETFDDDARAAARDLEIVLTQRDMGGGVKVPLAGIPYHALDSYLARLIKKGHRVAICEQTSEPDGRRLVDREVVRVVTPGTVVEPALLEESANSYLAAAAVDGERAGVAYVDVTTGEFAATETPVEWVGAELARLAPREVLLPADAPTPPTVNGESAAYLVTPRPASSFAPEAARRLLLDHFGAATLEVFGLDAMPLAAAAAGAAVDYLADTHKAALGLLHSLRVYSTESFMALDPQTRRNLELFEGGRRGERAHSLLGVLDATKTPMGARLLR
ncbi:MAG: DNA mismatch repair protein MutS, partial [Chloroflexota bacterium]|nr:DNA mismatch repair protein MutS [Chloroflexota bacterium]